jgi:hypothetical protein
MKNHLFIGLGGQGGKSIAELQKVFVNRSKDAESLKDNGQRWDLLYIDSSKDVTNERRNWVYFGKDLRLKPESFLYLKDDGESINAHSMAQRPDVSPWIGDVDKLQTFLEGSQGIQGANQRRRLGRLLIARNADRIRKAVCEDKITPMLSNGNECAIHIFASLAGGTGSGGIVDLVTMLRTAYPNASVDGGFPIFLYLYVTDREFEEAQVGYFHQNQSAALRDLNALCCGKFRPTLLGSATGAMPFKGDEPITQILLSSQLNSKNQMLSLTQQHQIVAEAAFERIYSFVSGSLDTIQQKAVTGEDKLPAYPGEPVGNLLRTFRFGSVGMRRWEVPIEEIRELLARNLSVSCYRRLLFNNWSETLGFGGEKLKSDIPGYTETSLQLDAIVEAEWVENTELPGLFLKLNEDFNRYYSGKKREGFKDLDLSAYEDELQKRYSSELDGKGVTRIFQEISERRNERLARIRDQIHNTIQRSWTRKDSVLGLAYAQDLLLQLQEKVRKKVFSANDANSNNDALRRRMDKRKIEWLKMTLLSRPLKQLALAQAHQSDLASILREDLRFRAKSEDRELGNSLTGILGQLASDYQMATGRLQEWSGEGEKRRDQLHRDLAQMLHGPGQSQDGAVANKAELSLENLEAHIKNQNLESTAIGNTCDELLERSLMAALGASKIPGLGNLTEDQKTHIRESGDTVLFKRAEQIHDLVRSRNHLESVLSGNVLDILEKRHNEDSEKFSTELLAFINSATCNIALETSDIQPKTLRQDTGMPSMPRTGLIVGLPKEHLFGAKLANMIKPLLEAGSSAVQGVYYHEDQTQVRMLFVTYWMAARFATVVHRLEAMYRDALAHDNEGDKAYFTNIDTTGQKGQRPPMLFPPAEELQRTMKSALWLGSKIHGPTGAGHLIQESNDQVVLIQQSENGIEPIVIGESLSALGKSADIVTIYRVNDAVSAAAGSLSEEQSSALRASLLEEDAILLKKLGPASAEYSAWVAQRNQIQTLLKR